MSQRRFYAHWLDGEIMHPRCLPQSSVGNRWRKIEGLLKMHAIFGDCICLSDVQLIDSRVILWLFAQADFRTFLKTNPRFFRLVARPTADLNVGTQTLAMVGAGLARSLAKSWISSTFDPPDITAEFANTFRGLKDASEARWALTSPNGPFEKVVESYSGPQKDLLKGMVWGLRHFVDEPDRVEPPSARAKSLSYFEVLEKAKNENHLDIVSSTLSFIEQKALNKYQRSPAIVAFENAGIDQDGNRGKYLNVVQAWNMGVSSTINADYDSAFAFRPVYPLPILLGPVAELTSAVSAAIGDQELFDSIERATWHPADLSWRTIADVTDKCKKEIVGYQDSIGTLESEGKFRALVAAVSKVVATHGKSIQKIPDWIEIRFEETKSFSGLLGQVLPEGSLDNVEDIGEIATETIRSLKVVTKVSEWLKAASTAEAIQAFAVRYNIHRPPV